MIKNQIKKLSWLVAVIILIVIPISVVQANDESLLLARSELLKVLEKRNDLRQLFDSHTWLPINDARTSGIVNLEDWALKYGYKEHAELSWYGTPVAETELAKLNNRSNYSLPASLIVRPNSLTPERKNNSADFDFDDINVQSVIVIDEGTRSVLLEKNADEVRPDAVTAKLTAVATALSNGVVPQQSVKISSTDFVGGLELPILVGATVTAEDLVFATLMASANNTVTALARSVSANQNNFIDLMKKQTEQWGLGMTDFSDPTGTVSGNKTTAREAVAVLIESMDNQLIRKAMTTSAKTITGNINVTNRNELLTDPNNGLYVYGGQVGYLQSAGWHMSVNMMALDTKKRIFVAVSGAETKEQLFADVIKVAKWSWDSYVWRLGQSSSNTDEIIMARQALQNIYNTRADLRKLFLPDSWQAVPSAQTTDIVDLEDWAIKYGCREHSELSWYGTEQARRIVTTGNKVVDSAPPALNLRQSSLAPIKSTDSIFNPANVTASSVYVVDVPTRKVLLAQNENAIHPIASITKLMTAMVAVDQKIPVRTQVKLIQADEIGGARLRVPVGSTLSLQDWLYVMLVGSANNAAHLVGRTVANGNVQEFVNRMNTKANDLGLKNTVFADPSGLNVNNISTAREVSALAFEAFDYYDIRKMCSTATYKVNVATGSHTVTNTNQLLTDENNGLIVLGGKTGYLIESKWNLAVRMMDRRGKQVMVIVFGSDTQKQSFRDAQTVAEWVWNNYRW